MKEKKTFEEYVAYFMKADKKTLAELLAIKELCKYDIFDRLPIQEHWHCPPKRPMPYFPWYTSTSFSKPDDYENIRLTN